MGTVGTSGAVTARVEDEHLAELRRRAQARLSEIRRDVVGEGAEVLVMTPEDAALAIRGNPYAHGVVAAAQVGRTRRSVTRSLHVSRQVVRRAVLAARAAGFDVPKGW